jgi:hypothetical protein
MVPWVKPRRPVISFKLYIICITNSPVFRNITPYSPLKVKRRFRGKTAPPSSGWEANEARRMRDSTCCLAGSTHFTRPFHKHQGVGKSRAEGKSYFQLLYQNLPRGCDVNHKIPQLGYIAWGERGLKSGSWQLQSSNDNHCNATLG